MLGGFNGQESLSSAECYDPLTNQWTLLQPMRECRSGVGVVAHRGCVYAAGGFNGTRRLNSVERYDPDEDEWRPLSPMLNARSNFAMTVSGDLPLCGRHLNTLLTNRLKLFLIVDSGT